MCPFFCVSFTRVNCYDQLATLNLCLGLKYKKDLVKDVLISNDLDILAMQETEVEQNVDWNLLGIKGYVLELENNTYKSRVGFYIKDTVKYVRCPNLEGQNSHLIVIDINNEKGSKKRLINMYRSFNPRDDTAIGLFNRQLEIVKNIFNNDSVLIGDLNLDYNKKFNVNYQRKNYFELFDELLGTLNLIQLVNFETWSRMVGLVLRSSNLDHIYVNNIHYCEKN